MGMGMGVGAKYRVPGQFASYISGSAPAKHETAAVPASVFGQRVGGW